MYNVGKSLTPLQGGYISFVPSSNYLVLRFSPLKSFSSWHGTHLICCFANYRDSRTALRSQDTVKNMMVRFTLERTLFFQWFLMIKAKQDVIDVLTRPLVEENLPPRLTEWSWCARKPSRPRREKRSRTRNARSPRKRLWTSCWPPRALFPTPDHLQTKRALAQIPVQEHNSQSHSRSPHQTSSQHNLWSPTVWQPLRGSCCIPEEWTTP